MDTRRAVARFEAERQALAQMDHPGVARVFDGGATAGGRPYFVMELVAGAPITRFSHEHKLPLRAQIDLFIQVCAAVQHAHQKGVIHRDLKPNNVLVARVDGRPSPKVIDFGVAKFVLTDLADAAITRDSQIIGTPAYMAPEQADSGAADIDTRADVYALGAMLYELLTGVTPHDVRSLASSGHAEMIRAIRELEPPRPSARAPERAASLRGDLDWIVTRCLEKERERRYDSAAALAEDLRRYLADEPVAASPPSVAYRCRKFVRRRKGAVAALGAVFVALLLGVVGLAVGLIQAASARNLALRAQQDERKQRMTAQSAQAAAEQERDRADEARDEAEAVGAFLTNMLYAADPYQEGADVTVRDALNWAAERVRAELGDRPLVEARIRHTIGMVYRNMDLYDPCEEQWAAALEIRRRELGPEHPDTLLSLNSLAGVYLSLGRYPEATTMLEQALAGYRRVLGEDHLDTLRAMNDLGVAYYYQSRYVEVEPLWRTAFERRRRLLGDEDDNTLSSLEHLSVLYVRLGRAAEGARLGEQVYEVRLRKLGEEHPATVNAANHLGAAYLDMERLEDAERFLRRAVELRSKTHGDHSPRTLSSMASLAQVLSRLERLDEAEPLLERVLAARRATLGAEHPKALQSASSLARLLTERGQTERAEALLDETLPVLRATLGDANRSTLAAQNNLARLYAAQGRQEESEALFQDTITTFEESQGADNVDTLSVTANYADALRGFGDHARAAALYRQALPRLVATLGATNGEVVDATAGLAQALVAQGQFSEAQSLLLDLHGLLAEMASPDPRRRTKVAQSLAELYAARDAAEPGQGFDREADAWRSKSAISGSGELPDEHVPSDRTP